MTYGWRKKSAQITLEFFMDWTGYSKSVVRRSLRELYDRNMILAKSSKGRPAVYAIQKDYEKWLDAKQSVSPGGSGVGVSPGGSTPSGKNEQGACPPGGAGSVSPPVNTHSNTNTNTSPEGKMVGTSNGRETWLTPYCEVWEAAYGGELPFGPAAKYLSDLQKKHGFAKVIEHFRNYCDAIEAQYVSSSGAALAKFHATFGSWATEKIVHGALDPQAAFIEAQIAASRRDDEQPAPTPKGSRWKVN
jgi:hypothetical protein